MNITQVMEQYTMQQELKMLDQLYEGMQQALAKEYQKSRTAIYQQYGVEEPQPEPPQPQPQAAVLGTDEEIPVDVPRNNAVSDDAVLRRAAGLGVVPGANHAA